MRQFLKFILGMKFYMFWTVPPSIIRNFSLYTKQWYMLCRFAVCTVENSWWTEEPSETCRVSFQNKNFWEISASSWFYYKKNYILGFHKGDAEDSILLRVTLCG